MVYIGTVSYSRNNNFNLIRFVAATAVLVSHAYPIALGPGTTEPLQELTGHTLGTLAVFAFFTISGFLISASFERSNDWRRFLSARALRLFPCLVISILLVALVMGPLVTTHSLSAYFLDPNTWTFILRNTALVQPQYTLPGVFETNPYVAVEGSIWTLFYEVICYLGVFGLGIVGILKRQRLMTIIFLAYLVSWHLVIFNEYELHGKLRNLHTLSLPFAVGTAFYVWRDKIPLSFLIVIGTTSLALILHKTFLFEVILVLALGYTIFWLSYIPKGFLLKYNLFGDYSYGIYVYAFPIQGWVVWIWGPQQPIDNFFLAFPITLSLSIISWHWIEKPSLSLLKQ